MSDLLSLDEAAKAALQAQTSHQSVPLEVLARLYRLPFRVVGVTPVPAKAAHRRRFHR